MLRLFSPSLLVVLLCGPSAVAQEKEGKAPVYSGPQVGEKLPGFKVKGVFGDAAGKELDFVKSADGKPIVLVFVHDLNRMSLSLTRTLTAYTAGRAKDGLHTGVVWLTDDVTEAENTLKRVKQALAKDAPLGISPDGKEGPGSYGLNRAMTLTILVGKDNKVTANFALVQPSLQADLPKILDAVVKVAGGKAPKIEDLMPNMAARDGRARPAAALDAKVRELLGPVIRLNAKSEDVEKAAKAVEDYAKSHEAFKKDIGRRANIIIDGGKLENYGTPKAQEYLKKWAKEYGGKKDK
ncbi:MAG TPA: hypothetical protein VGJ05_00675 [Fimbriiglobus sp.]|jgi:ribosomal protein L10